MAKPTLDEIFGDSVDNLPKEEEVSEAPRPSLDEIFSAVPTDESGQPIEIIPEEERRSELGAFASNLKQGLTFGFGDEIEGALKAGWDKVTGAEGDFGDLYRTHRDLDRAELEAAREQHPGWSAAGEIVGSVAPALLPGGLAAVGARGAAGLARAGAGQLAKHAIKAGAAQGAAYGAGTSTAELTGDLADGQQLTKFAGDTLLGGAIGGALPGVARGVKNLPKKILGDKQFNLLRDNPDLLKLSKDKKALARLKNQIDALKTHEKRILNTEIKQNQKLFNSGEIGKNVVKKHNNELKKMKKLVDKEDFKKYSEKKQDFFQDEYHEGQLIPAADQQAIQTSQNIKNLESLKKPKSLIGKALTPGSLIGGGVGIGAFTTASLPKTAALGLTAAGVRKGTDWASRHLASKPKLHQGLVKYIGEAGRFGAKPLVAAKSRADMYIEQQTNPYHRKKNIKSLAQRLKQLRKQQGESE